MPTDVVSRRQFAARLAAASTLPLLASPMPLVQAAEKEKAEPEKEEPEKAPAAPSVAVVQPPTVAELLLELVKRQYPKGLSAEHDQPIRKAIERNLARSRTLSMFPLSNADEPTTTFAAWRADG